MIKDNKDGTFSIVRPQVWNSCVACGQTVSADSIHTCSPQIKGVQDALETLEYLLDVAESGVADGNKTLNSEFVILLVKEAMEELKQ